MCRPRDKGPGLSWLHSIVDVQVLNEAELVGEGFPTLAAFVRPSSRVDSVVLNEAVALAEGSPTVTALIRLCCRVSSLAVTKGGALVEGILALIRTSLRVNLMMLKEFVFAVTVPIMTRATTKGLSTPILEAAG